jgi:hypothetical protein
MKVKSLILLFVLISAYQWLNSTTWHIKQDSTGNFTNIQEGIVASSDTDTVLVYSGTYFENIDYLEKNIILASLYLTTGNEDYIHQTIIDGNHNGSCVEIRNCTEDYNTLCGFTLRNGTGNQQSPTHYGIVGGGVLVYDSHININNCDIYNNKSEYGGGIFCKNSTIMLSGVLISNNRSYKRGGGIFLFNNSEIIFSNNDLCDIYLNYGSWSGEICKTSDCPPMHVIVDTFTVMNPDFYFVMCHDPFGNPINDITLDIQNAKLESIDADLYVATDGDNANSGLTSEEPLATINYAYSLIQPDSLENNTIYVADGEYSTTFNNQWFPLQMRGYVNLVGESMDNTIFDGEEDSPLITDKVSEINYAIKNLTLKNGYGVSGQGTGTPWSTICINDSQMRDKWVILENIKSYNCESNSRDIALWFVSAYIKNVHIYDNLGNANVISSLGPSENEFPYMTVDLENCSFRNCDTDGLCFGFGFYQEELSPIILINVEITNNFNTDTEWPHAFSALVIDHKRKVDMINCTIGNNTSLMTGGAIGCIGKGSELNIYNSILYSNDPANIWIGNDYEDDPFIVNIQNSLLEFGELSITNAFNWNIVNWLGGNLEEDPLWDVTGDNPYALMADSPCIDAGTLELPPGIELPEFDLAGNPRIYGDFIDMGAYEWQGVGVEDNELEISNFTLSNYPNPFNPETKIVFNLPEEGNVKIEIYNIKGQKVKTLLDCYMSPGRSELIWNGKDDNGKRVSSGVYFYQLVTEKKTITKKMILIK